ncbi:Hypothetical predicted protein, partial [Pelobates cultripes]
QQEHRKARSASQTYPGPAHLRPREHTKLHDGEKKMKNDYVVAPIFRSRSDKGLTRAEDQRETDSDSDASDMEKNAPDLNPITRGDLKELLRDIKANMVTELAKHMALIREGLEDRTRSTLA